VVGTLGQLPKGAVVLIETMEAARTFQPKDASKLAFVTQTTLSIDDTKEIVAVLKERFPTSTARTRKTSATPPPTASSR
jgi:4-hydroxy-3-methylbut-2-enyl diphosphate reductase